MPRYSFNSALILPPLFSSQLGILLDSGGGGGQTGRLLEIMWESVHTSTRWLKSVRIWLLTRDWAFIIMASSRLFGKHGKHIMGPLRILKDVARG